MSKSISVAHLPLPTEISLCTISFIVTLIPTMPSAHFTLMLPQLPFITSEVLLISTLTTEENLQEAHFHTSAVRTCNRCLSKTYWVFSDAKHTNIKTLSWECFIQVSQHCRTTLTNLAAQLHPMQSYLHAPPASEGAGKVRQDPVHFRIFRCLVLAETNIMNKYKLLPNNLYYI